MARYSHEFMDMEADPRGWRGGADPNYRGGYRGARMHGDHQQAAYGWHRWRHETDLEGSGGYMGRYDQPERSMREGGWRPPHRGYDAGWEGGGVRDLRHDPRAMRDFNAHSPVVRYGGDYGRPRYDDGPRGRRLPGHYQGERFDYANRGIGSGGYGEGWAWGPMRGAR